MKQLKLTITTLLLVLLCTAHATTYYFSSTAGNDSNKINSINSPFRSLNKLNKLKLAYGDIIDFKCGDTWYGSITTNTQGVTYKSYGTGSRPTITGFTPVRNWAPIGNGIYKSSPLTTESAVRMVTMDGKVMGKGRYPNADADTKGFLLFEAFGTYYLQDQQLNTTPIDSTWVGAEMKIRTYRGYMDGVTLSSVDKVNGYLGYTGSENMSSQPWAINYGYFITNSIKTLDQLGEWYFNPKDSCLYVYFGTDNPHIHNVQATTIDVLLHPRNNYLSFDNLVFDGANKYVVENSWKGVHDLSITNSIIVHAGINGIALACRANFYMYNCKVLYCNTNGVIIGYKCDNAYLKENTIDNIGMIAANLFRDTIYQSRVGFGLFSADTDSIGLKATGNTITNIGYIALFFNRSNNDIENNYVSNFCVNLDDGGGIYYTNPVIGNYKNNFIRHNVVTYGMSQPVGTANYLDRMASGVYCDERTTGMTVEDNFIAFNAQDGIFIHNSNGISVLNNTMAFNGAFAFHLQDGPTLPKVNNILFSGNSMYADGGRQLIYGFYTAGQGIGASGLDSFGVFDRNYIYSPNNATISYVADWSIPYYGFFYTLDQIRSNLPYDKYSVLSNTASVYKVLYTTNSTTTFYFKGETYYTIQGVPVRDSVILKARTGIILLKYTG